MSHTVVIAGAGIGGLTTALALAAKGFHVVLHEKAVELEEAGAGIQLSPNATRILIGLGLEQAVAARAVTPDGITIRAAQSGNEIARIPLGSLAQARYGAPYWISHRADLQAALLAHVRRNPAIELHLDTPFETALNAPALIGADGVWSNVRRHYFGGAQANFTGHVAWRGTLDAKALPAGFAPDRIALWFGSGAHLVVYPIRNGTLVNVVALVEGQWNREGWNETGDAAEITAAFDPQHWSPAARDLIRAVETWRKWALFSVASTDWARGPVALIGDAAVIANCLARTPDNPAAAFQRYAALRRPRVAQVKRTTWQSGMIYHLPAPFSLARNIGMKLLGGERLLAQRDSIYRWQVTS